MPNWFKYQTNLNKTLSKEGNCRTKNTRADYNSCMAKYTYTLNNQRNFLEKWQKAHPLSTSGSRPTSPDPLQAAKNQVARQKAELAAKKLAAVAVAPILNRQGAYIPNPFTVKPRSSPRPPVTSVSTPRSNTSTSSIFFAPSNSSRATTPATTPGSTPATSPRSNTSEKKGFLGLWGGKRSLRKGKKHHTTHRKNNRKNNRKNKSRKH